MTYFDGGRIPLLVQEGWTRRQEDAAKPPLKERARIRSAHARLRHFGGFASFFLLVQPPLLHKEGNVPR